MLHRIRVWWLATCCLALLTVACSSIWANSERYPTDRQLSLRETRIIRHALGDVEIPVNPQQIITLDGSGLENALALGIRPVGTTFNTAIDQPPAHLNGKLSGVEHVGTIRQPSLDKILTLNPDLILSMTGLSDDIYSQLTQIAPTVLASFGGGGDRWKGSFTVHANALDKSDLAEQWMQRYQERLSTFRQQMGDRFDTLEVSVVRLYPDGPSLYLPNSFAGKILQEAGLSRPLSQRSSEVQQRISRELLGQADGDVLFVWETNDDPHSQAKDSIVTQLKSDPLWSQLKAVQNDKVYEVPGYWLGFGPIAADAVVDDLFTYLLEES